MAKMTKTQKKRALKQMIRTITRMSVLGDDPTNALYSATDVVAISKLAAKGLNKLK